jgi:hypothetical protein
MYDDKTGLLKEIHLTQDHHGLSAYDFKGDKYQVVYEPALNGFGGDAKWVKSSNVLDTPGLIGTAPEMLTDFYVLDKRGLPKVEQLNYFYDYGKGYKDKKGKTWILTCGNRKNKKSWSIHPSNCIPKKDGTFQMKWEPADGKKPWSKAEVPKGPEDRKFFLPDGSVVTGNQLNKLSLEEIWRMMMLLELMEQGPAYAQKLKSLGLGPYAPDGAAALGVGQIPGTLKSGRKQSLLDGQERADEEKRFAEAGLDTCEFPNPGIRCYSDSYIPGACVPHEGICFNSDYSSPWSSSKNHGQNPKMQWAKARRADLEAAGALESEQNYRLWKAQQDQKRMQAGVYGTTGGVALATDTSSNVSAAGKAAAAAAAARGMGI